MRWDWGKPRQRQNDLLQTGNELAFLKEAEQNTNGRAVL
jgi:hypothetical protein